MVVISSQLLSRQGNSTSLEVESLPGNGEYSGKLVNYYCTYACNTVLYGLQ